MYTTETGPFIKGGVKSGERIIIRIGPQMLKNVDILRDCFDAVGVAHAQSVHNKRIRSPWALN